MNEIVPGQNVKSPGSSLDNASGSEAKKLSRKQVEIPEDVWLVALKFLTGRQWSKLRFVSHQLNSLLQRNISQLPLVVIDEVLWSKPGGRTQIAVKVAHTHKHQLRFMKELAINMEELLEILYHPALYIKVVSMSTQQDIQGTFPVDDSRYIRCERFMLETAPAAPPSSSHNFFGNRSHQYSVNASGLHHYVLWMEQKVRAGQIDLHNSILQLLQSPARVFDFGYDNKNNEGAYLQWQEQERKANVLSFDRAKALDVISDFIFGSLRICASKVATFSLPDASIAVDSVQFLNTLIAKFRTLTTIESGIPKIQIYPYPTSIQYREHLGPNLCEDSRENDFWPCSRAVYVISNEHNRMRISFHKPTYYDSRPDGAVTFEFRPNVNINDRTPNGGTFGFDFGNANTNRSQERRSLYCYDVCVTFYTV